MTEAEHSNADPAPGRADTAAEVRGEKDKANSNDKSEIATCSPAEAEANAKQTAQRAS